MTVLQQFFRVLSQFLAWVHQCRVLDSDTFLIMTSRILGAFGRFFITSGVVILLFVAYQLWGTGLQEAAAQGDLASDFDELLLSVDETSTTTVVPTTTTTAATDVSTTSAPTTTLPPAGGTIPVYETELAEKLYLEGGAAIARINIPKIGVTKVVVQGVQVEDLRNGPGHYRSTVFPGQMGNSGIAGHRTTYGAPFNRIDELTPGDDIRVQTVQGIHEYRVLPAGEAYSSDAIGALTDFEVPDGDEDLGHIIVGPEATWVLADFGDDRITLTACHPKYSARQRIIVTAELVTPAVDTPLAPEEYATSDAIDLTEEDLTGAPLDGGGGQDAPDAKTVSDPADAAEDQERDEVAAVVNDEASLDEGLNGDKSALRPAILWGLAAVAAYLGFKELGRRWRRWPAIAMGLIPVVVLMSLSFEKIDRYLPAG